MINKLNIRIALLLLILLSLVSITTAFFTKSIETNNVITFGSVNIKLHESYIDENGEEVPFDTTKKENINDDYTKERLLRVENVGKHPVYVRLYLSFSEVEGEPLEGAQIEAESDYWIYENGWFYYTEILEPGIKTKELVTNVSFDIDMITTRHPNNTLTLNAEAQGVQSENNMLNVLEVTGWPEEEVENEE